MKLGPQGRIVIPAEIRRELELEEGDELAVVVEDGSLVLQSRRRAAARLRGSLRHALGAGESGVDSFLAGKERERLVETERELRRETGDRGRRGRR